MQLVSTNRVVVVTLVGFPASGKSHTCSLLLSNHDSACDVTWISFDHFIPTESLGLDPSELEWKKWRNRLLCCVERLLYNWSNKCDYVPESFDTACLPSWNHLVTSVKRCTSSNDCTKIILLDDNFYYSSMRRPYYQLAKKFQTGFAVLFCQSPLALCIDRNSKRDCPIPTSILAQMSDRLEPPNPNRRAWERHTFIVDSSLARIPTDAIFEFLTQAANDPFSETYELEEFHQREEDRKITAQSLLHAVDNALRDTASSILLLNENIWRQQNAKTISSVKSECLIDIRRSIQHNAWNTTYLEDQLMDAVSLFKRRLLEKGLL